MHQHSRGRDACELSEGNFGEGHRQIQAAEQLTDVEQIQTGLALQQALHLVTDVVAQERHAVVQSQGLADGDGDVAATTGPGKAQHLRCDWSDGAEGADLLDFGIQGCHVGVRQPNPTGLERLPLKLMPVTTGARTWCVLHGPHHIADPVFPLFKLLAARMIGVGQLMEQGDSFNAGCLLRSPLLQVGFGVPDLKKPAGWDFQQLTGFTSPEVFQGAAIEQSQPTHQSVRRMPVDGAPRVLGRQADQAA